MNHQALALMLHEGSMSDYDINNPASATRPRVVGSLPTATPPGGHSTRDTWANVIGSIATTAFQAFGRNPVYQQQQQATYTPQQIAAMQQAQGQGQQLIGGGVTSQGLQIGGTSISWPIIALAAAGIYLMQRQPYRR